MEEVWVEKQVKGFWKSFAPKVSRIMSTPQASYQVEERVWIERKMMAVWPQPVMEVRWGMSGIFPLGQKSGMRWANIRKGTRENGFNLYLHLFGWKGFPADQASWPHPLLPQVDTLKALLRSPSVLVCASHEPFRTLAMEDVRRNGMETLSGQILRNKNGKYVWECPKSYLHWRVAQ